MKLFGSVLDALTLHITSLQGFLILIGGNEESFYDLDVLIGVVVKFSSFLKGLGSPSCAYSYTIFILILRCELKVYP